MNVPIDKCKRLSQIHSGEDILRLSAAVSPGSHCPLFGVVMCAPYISDLAVLILGDTECCFHAYHQHMTGGNRGLLCTYSMDDLDIVYGVEDGLKAAVERLYARYHFPAILLVSSCVPEMTGEDLEKLAKSCDIPVPVLTAHTSHYNSTGYYTGISHFYLGLLPLISEAREKNGKIAVLGARYPGLADSEIPAALKAQGYEVFVPGSVSDIASLSSVSLNLVSDVTALEFAMEIEKRFGVPYLRMDHLLCPEKILQIYRDLDGILGCHLAESAELQYNGLMNRMNALKVRWTGKTFLFAVPFCLPFEACEFFCSMGLKPVWLVARDVYPGDGEIIERLVDRGIDPPVSSFASLSNLVPFYKELQPDLYFAFAARVPGALVIHPASCASMTGFSFPEMVVSRMEAYEKGAIYGS